MVVGLFIPSIPVAHAQSGLEVLENQVELNIPENLVFGIKAKSGTEIDQLILRYKTNARLCQEVNAEIRPDFEPGKEIEAEWEWDFQRTGTLPPGAQLSWQWELTDENGKKTTTDWQEITVQDPRHDWKQIQDGFLTLQYYAGSEADARKLLGFARKGLEKLQENTGIQPNSQIWMTIYPDYPSLQEYLALSTEWTGGRAYPEYNSILLGVPEDSMTWAKEAVPHELTHLVVAEQTFNCLGTFLPTWMNEGLAVNVEGEIPQAEQDVVLQALETDRLPTLVSLSNGFSPYPEQANRSYTQSGMVIQYLIDTFGPEEMGKLLMEIKRGQTIDEALQTVYGLNTNSLDAAWRKSLGFVMQAVSPTQAVVRTPIPTLPLMSPQGKKTSTPEEPTQASPTPIELAQEGPATPTSTPLAPTEPAIPIAQIEQASPEPQTIPWTPILIFLGVVGLLILAWILIKRKNTK